MCAYVFRFVRLPAGLCVRKRYKVFNANTTLRCYHKINRIVDFFLFGKRSFFVFISTPSSCKLFSHWLTVPVDGTCIRSIEKFYKPFP